MLTLRICLGCGNQYMPRRTNQKYCSPECRPEVACLTCGKLCVQLYGPEKRFCSLECKEEFRKAEFTRLQERTYIKHAVSAPAHAAVSEAIKDGRLVKGPCSVCGTTEGVEGHHRDYTKPLSVQWLCHAHHMQEHVRMRKCGERVILPQDWRLQMVKSTERKIEGNRLAYTLREAASLTGVPYHTLHRFLKTGDIRPIQGFRTRISRKELERFLETTGQYEAREHWLKESPRMRRDRDPRGQFQDAFDSGGD